MMDTRRIAYVNQFTEYSEGCERLFENLLFYKTQYEGQTGKPEDSLSFGSRFNLSGIRMDPEKTIYDFAGLRPKEKFEYMDKRKFAVILTHDVDNFFPSMKYRLYASVKELSRLRMADSVKTLASKKNNYDTFQKIMGMERSYDAKSTFFFVSAKSNYPTKNYDLLDVASSVGALVDEDFEIGLHGGTTAITIWSPLSTKRRGWRK